MYYITSVSAIMSTVSLKVTKNPKMNEFWNKNVTY